MYSPPLVEQAQEPRLDLVGDLAELVEEQRALLGLSDETEGRARARVREVPAAAEEEHLDERLGEGRRVARDDRHAAAVGQEMNRPGDELLAGARIPAKERVRLPLHPGHHRDEVEELPEERGLADEAELVALSEPARLLHREVEQPRHLPRPLHALDEHLVLYKESTVGVQETLLARHAVQEVEPLPVPFHREAGRPACA